MNMSHGSKVEDFMTEIKDMMLMSKHSSPRDILETMRLNNCKHMPLVDDYSGDIISIVDIRDIVLSATKEKILGGAGKTERYARKDVGRNSAFWISRAGTRIKEISKLDGDCDLHQDHPFHDGHHVLWDDHDDTSTEMQQRDVKDVTEDSAVNFKSIRRLLRYKGYCLWLQ